MLWNSIFLSVTTVVVLGLSYFLYLLPIHLLTILIIVVSIIVSDIMGLLWIMGKLKTVPTKTSNIFHILVGTGLWIMILTGFIMFVPVKDYLLSSSAFMLKMLFVLALVLNSFLIGKHLKIAQENSFKNLHTKERIFIVISGLVSTIAWVGAYTAAQLLGL